MRCGCYAADMKMVLEIPDEISAELDRKLADPARAALEALAAAAMVRVLERALQTIESQSAHAEASAFERLRAVTRWTLEVQLAGEMPSLPSQNSSLRTTLIADKVYVDLVMEVSERIGEWIVQAQADGAITPKLPPEVILYTLFARACDPVLGFLKATGQHSDEQIVDWVLSTCLDGLAARP